MIMYEWNHLPTPFNPQLDERAVGWHDAVIRSMQADGLYDTMTQPERSDEYRRRYEDVRSKALGSP